MASPCPPSRSWGFMMLGAGKGSEVEIRGTGPDVTQALAALVALVEAGFNEQD